MTDEIKEAIAAAIPWMTRYAWSLSKTKEDGEDLAMDSYLKAVQAEYNGKISLRGWLATIIEHGAIDRARRNRSKDGGFRYQNLPPDWDDKHSALDCWTDASHRVRPLDTFQEFQINPWEEVDTRILADAILETVTDGELVDLSTTVEQARQRLGVTLCSAKYKRTRTRAAIRERAEEIL